MDPTQAKAVADAATAAAKSPMNTDLVFLSVGFVVVMAALTLLGLWRTKTTHDFETQKLRFAAVTFTGILTLFVFAATVFLAGGTDSPGNVIFDKGLTAMFTLAGTVVGYLFGSAAKAGTPLPPPPPPGG
ncbi:hypothetical protein [Variovorax paradoxus]|jgi:hypothetical protein|uniref:hypothetical protein n=1 Tax=Variovorax paradoxus TaxID=34073 RepID=UPI0033920187